MNALRQFPRRFLQCRGLATTAPGPGTPTFRVFNRETKRLQRDRAAKDVETSRSMDYVRMEVADRVVDRMLYIKRPFQKILDLGSGPGLFAQALYNTYQINEKEQQPIDSRFSKIIQMEMSKDMLYRDTDAPFNKKFEIERLQMDEETPEFPNDSFDAVVSICSMNWINDLPGALYRIRNMLKPDAPFICAMFGGDTLSELRSSLQLAESERRGGVSPRVSPLADVKDMGGLMQKAGFNMLTIDVEDIVIDYPSMFELMVDLQAMGEGNAVIAREMGAVGRDVLMAAQAIYQQLHGNEDGTIPATFRIIHIIGWKDSPDQPKPLKRGSGELSMKDFLEKNNKK